MWYRWIDAHITYITYHVSNVKLSGHLYFSIKDPDTSINATCFKNILSKIKIKIQNGDAVELLCKVDVYKRFNNINLIVYDIKKTGTGDLYKQYLEIKEAYEKKGYFEHKKKLPELIKNVGIVTAKEGAAIQDILTILRKNKFSGNIIVKNCLVQGNECPKAVSKAINYLSNYLIDKKKLDVILITRGGGSFEDLIGFSDPLVLEEIHKCDICTISAVGHEVDFMLSDFVADIRAPTPTASAELISSKYVQYAQELDTCDSSIKTSIIGHIQNMILTYEKKLDSLEFLINKPYLELQNKFTQLSDNILSQLIGVINKKLTDYDLDIHRYETHIKTKQFETMTELSDINTKIKSVIFDRINSLENQLDKYNNTLEKSYHNMYNIAIFDKNGKKIETIDGLTDEIRIYFNDGTSRVVKILKDRG